MFALHTRSHTGTCFKGKTRTYVRIRRNPQNPRPNRTYVLARQTADQTPDNYVVNSVFVPPTADADGRADREPCPDGQADPDANAEADCRTHPGAHRLLRVLTTEHGER